ncbi:MAG: carboxypeptidase-like regulatory domain-containing protein [Acidobacteriia bacterium]|nr:carboxypeptidase-like regulatory domain-containing protein [Terriglobia bacterium]
MQGTAFAQSLAERPAAGSISGMVTDAFTGTPILGITVSAGAPAPRTGVIVPSNSPAGSDLIVKTDAQGRYKFPDLKPGEYVITVHPESIPQRPMGVIAPVSKHFTLTGGQDLASADFAVEVPGSISGNITGPEKEPLAGISVLLIEKAYRNSRTAYGQSSGTTTDAKGRYTLALNVRPGRSYAILARPMVRSLAPTSTAPKDPEERKLILTPTYYPNATTAESAQTVSLRSGEDLENVNIRMAESKSYCAEGIALAEGSPAALEFELSEAQTTNTGLTGAGGFTILPPRGTTANDGKLRICDLHPGEYFLRVAPPGAWNRPGAPGLYAAVPLTITDHDLADIRVNAIPGMQISGEVVWDGEPPANPPDVRIRIVASPVMLNRNVVQVERLLPGRFTLDRLPVEEYSLRMATLPPSGFYIKDVTYGGVSIWRNTIGFFTPGGAFGGAGMKVTVAADGGTISAMVADKDGNPVQSASVCFLPAPAGTPAELANGFTCTSSDAAGSAMSGTLAPGKYRVLAAPVPIDRSAANIDRLWGARLIGQEVELAPKGSMRVNLTPISLY